MLPSRHRCRAGVALAIGLAAASPIAGAQATDNLAPRIGLPGAVGPTRADTLCVGLQPAAELVFPGLAIDDADVASGALRVRVELEPGAAGASAVAIPGLAALPGVAIILVRGDRIRFTAPLGSVNAALGALRYQADAAQLDLLDVIVDDQQLPPLAAALRFYIDVRDAPATAIARCRPPPDLRPASDTGASDTDDITLAVPLDFDVGGLAPGDQVQLFNENQVVDSAMAVSSTLVLRDALPIIGLTGFYSVSVNGDAGSAAWSVAIVPEPALFGDDFE